MTDNLKRKKKGKKTRKNKKKRYKQIQDAELNTLSEACCVFVLFFLVLCTICCQFLWIVLSIVDCPFDILLRLFTYIYFHFIFLMLYSAHASDWDHFTFSQEWPQTTCILGKEEVRTQFIFKIETDMKIGLYITLVISGFDQMSIEYGIPWFQFPAEGTNQRRRNCYLFLWF